MKIIRKRPVFRLCNDSVFKELFSKVPNALLLLISDVLKIEYDTIKTNSTVMLASELHKNREQNKTTICDFVVKVNDCFHVNIEINTSYYKGLTERNLLYTSRILSNSVLKGTDYSDLPKYKVRQLNINSFRNLNGKTLSKFMIVDETGMIMTESLFIYNFDIEKCFRLYYNEIDVDADVNERIIKWGTILYTTDISSIDEIMGDDFMNKEDKEQFIKVTEELQEKHRYFTDEEIIQLTEWKMQAETLAAREKGLDEGRAEGRILGRAEGLEEGFEEGIEQGFEQGIEQGIEQKSIEIVENMLLENIDISLISKISGLTEEEIIKIKESK